MACPLEGGLSRFLSPTAWWSAVRTADYRRVGCFLFFLIGFGAVEYWVVVSYYRSPLFYVAGYSLVVSRSTAMIMLFVFAFCILSACRRTMTILRSTPLNYIIPFDDAVDFHQTMGVIGLLLALIHSLSHIGNVLHVFKRAAAGFPSLYAAEHLIWNPTIVATGLLMLLVMFLALPFALKWPRTAPWLRDTHLGAVLNNFTVFYITHQVFVVTLVTLLILHPVPGFSHVNGNLHYLPIPYTWMWLALPLVIYAVEKLLLLRAHFSEAPVLGASLLDPGVLTLELAKPPGFVYQPGQYVFIRCRDISPFEWHPFSLSSSPKDNFLQVHIKNAGDWTGALHECVAASMRRGAMGAAAALATQEEEDEEAALEAGLPAATYGGPGAGATLSFEAEPILEKPSKDYARDDKVEANAGTEEAGTAGRRLASHPPRSVSRNSSLPASFRVKIHEPGGGYWVPGEAHEEEARPPTGLKRMLSGVARRDLRSSFRSSFRNDIEAPHATSAATTLQRSLSRAPSRRTDFGLGLKISDEFIIGGANVNQAGACGPVPSGAYLGLAPSSAAPAGSALQRLASARAQRSAAAWARRPSLQRLATAPVSRAAAAAAAVAAAEGKDPEEAQKAKGKEGKPSLASKPSLARTLTRTLTGRRLGRLASMLGKFSSARLDCPVEAPHLALDGPFGAPAQDHRRFRRVVLIGMGIGITPMLAIMRDTLHRLSASAAHNPVLKRATSTGSDVGVKEDGAPVLLKAYMHWVVADARAGAWLRTEFEMVSLLDCTGDVFCSHVHVTGPCPEAAEGAEVWTPTPHACHNTAITYGRRPDFHAILQDIQAEVGTQRTGVFYCGPRPARRAIQGACAELNRAHGARFEVHTEQF